MASKEIHNEVRVVSSVLPAVKTADTNGTGADLALFNAAEIVFHIGVRGDTWDASNYIELEIQESADDSAYTACANASITDFVTGTNTGTFKKLATASVGSQAYRVGYLGALRYVRPVFNFTGTHTTGTAVAAEILLAKSSREPVANP